MSFRLTISKTTKGSRFRAKLTEVCCQTGRVGLCLDNVMLMIGQQGQIYHCGGQGHPILWDPCQIRLQISHHRRAVAQHCINGDSLSQRDKAKFDASQNRDPLTDCQKNCHSWLRPERRRVHRKTYQQHIKLKLESSLRQLFLGALWWDQPFLA